MNHARTVALVAALFGLVACGGAPAKAPSGPAPTTTSASPPRSLDAALAAQGLQKIELATASDTMTMDQPGVPAFTANRVTMTVSSGWNQSPPTFARRADGKVVLVDAQPNVIVDRHVAAGCRTFFGGRMWMRTVTFELPAGATWGPTTKVSWDQHVEVEDYTDHAPGGGPCPPPAID